MYHRLCRKQGEYNTHCGLWWMAQCPPCHGPKQQFDLTTLSVCDCHLYRKINGKSNKLSNFEINYAILRFLNF